MTPEEIARRHLAALDAAWPGRVEALYLTGSAVLGDWWPGRSDVDAVVVTAGPVTGADLAAVAHPVDGVYLDRTTFAARPTDERPVPHVVGGVVRTGEPCGELHPVLWLTLVRYGVAVRGPVPTGPEPDPAAVRAWTRANLDGYWRRTAERARAAAAAVPGDTGVPADPVVWLVLGPPRLHHTLATGDVIGKSAAGAHLARRWPVHAGLAERAVRHRRGGDGRFTAADLAEAADAAAAVIRG